MKGTYEITEERTHQACSGEGEGAREGVPGEEWLSPYLHNLKGLLQSAKAFGLYPIRNLGGLKADKQRGNVINLRFRE